MDGEYIPLNFIQMLFIAFVQVIFCVIGGQLVFYQSTILINQNSNVKRSKNQVLLRGLGKGAKKKSEM